MSKKPYIKDLSIIENLYIDIHGVCPPQEKNISLHSYNEMIVFGEIIKKECLTKILEICNEEYSAEEKINDILKYAKEKK